MSTAELDRLASLVNRILHNTAVFEKALVVSIKELDSKIDAIDNHLAELRAKE